MTKTYLFYDIETSGLNKAFDQVVQFAAIRTDLALNELDRTEFLIRLNPDVVPSPKAFITHRLSIARLAKGLSEYEAIQKIHALLNTPGTISIGYNSLGFDDEFLRFSFYRNLLPPYTHQYANQCSRMDLYPITVMYFLFKNELLNWPDNNLKLENLIKANQLTTGMAHNAMVDVEATLKLATYFQRDSKTWTYLTEFFAKSIDQARCQQVSSDPNSAFGIVIDGKFGPQQNYQAAAMSLGMHRYYKNQSIWLRLDLPQLQQATPDDFLQHTWVINKKLGEPGWILPMKTRFLHSYLKERYLPITQTHQWLLNNTSLHERLCQHYLNYQYPKIARLDVDAALYDQGFLSNQDQDICQQIHLASPKKKLSYLRFLSTPLLQQQLIRLIGRHEPAELVDEHAIIFNDHLESIKKGDTAGNCLDYRGIERLTPQQAYIELQALNQQPLDYQQKEILNELEQYLCHQFDMGT